MLQSIARKVLMGFQGSLGDTLNKEDPQGDGLLPIETVSKIIKDKKIQALQPSELEFLMAQCDMQGYGFIIISRFHEKLLEYGQESEEEVKLRRFAKTIGNQGINLRAEMAQFDHQRKGTLDQVQFKRAMKQLAVALTDVEIKDLFEMVPKTSRTGGSEQLEIAGFVRQVNEAQKAKPLPGYMNAAAKPGRKVASRIGMGSQLAEGGAAGATGS